MPHASPLYTPARTQVKALAKDARYAGLYQLLAIFSTGGLSDYHAFVSAHGELVASLGIDSERSVETMRLFTLVSLGAASPTLDFATVAGALQVRWLARVCARARAGRACAATTTAMLCVVGLRQQRAHKAWHDCAADYTQFLVCERAPLIRRADPA